MTPGVISFSCSACGTRLTVPEAMAGVSGPCPRCSATIQAPSALPAAAPASPPLPAAPSPLPTPAAAPPPANPEPPVPEARPADVHLTTIRPEPRSKPERRRAKGIAPRHSTDDAALKRSRTAPVSSRSSRPNQSGPGIGRFILPFIFLVAGGTIVYVLCYFFLPDGPGGNARRVTSAPPIPPSVTNHSETSESGVTSPLPASPNPNQRVEDPPPISADGADAILAEEILNRFLSSRSLDERIELIDPPLPAEQLQKTILVRPMPEVIGVTPETPSFDNVEKLVNFPFRVQFQGGEGSIAEYTILVRKRSDLEPRVVVKPFLDLVGGRLARFAATPTEGIHTFHAIIEAMPRCFEENIPNPDKKFTYKLCASNVGRATARAYASRYSSLAEQLFPPDPQIRWGRQIRATFTLQWNTTEDPAQPYIELIEIKGLNWNQ